MASEWKTFRLNDVYDFSSGLSKPRSDFGFGHGFLTFKDVFDNFFVPDSLTALVNSTEKEREACSIRRGDVFLTRTSETQDELGMSCVALKDYESATFNGFTKRLRPKPNTEIVPEYAAYFFRGPKFRSDVTAMSSMSTRASLNNEMLARLSIVLPPTEIQTAIGHILKSLDDKIELNRRMNATLEAIAQALFKSWFVDFDPVKAKAAGRAPEGMDADTAALFPSEFQDSELGPIPKGWQVETIKQVAEKIQYGLTQSAKSEPIGPRFLRITDIQGGKVDWSKVPYCSASNEEVERYQICSGDILVARTGASTGENIYIVAPPLAVFASYLVRFQFCDPGVARLIACHMRSPNYFDYVKGCLGGSAQPNANAQILAGDRFVLPSDRIAARFYDLLKPIDLQCSINSMEAQTLAEIRDALLPKLISGQLRIPAGGG